MYIDKIISYKQKQSHRFCKCCLSSSWIHSVSSDPCCQNRQTFVIGFWKNTLWQLVHKYFSTDLNYAELPLKVWRPTHSDAKNNPSSLASGCPFQYAAGVMSWYFRGTHVNKLWQFSVLTKSSFIQAGRAGHYWLTAVISIKFIPYRHSMFLQLTDALNTA